MAYTAVPTVATGDTWTAANHNTYIRDNFAAGVPDVFTTKGDLFVGTGVDAGIRVGVGADGTVLQADSAQTTGVAWGTAFPTGVILPYAGATAPTAWLFTDGRTIGNAASGATNRANADTATLFAHLWDNFGNTELPIQDSGGSPSSRGANAATDFAANKRMPLPDLRGRVPVGKDDMGGSAANRITSGGSGIAGTTLGAAGGAETHTLSTSQMPPHSHTFQAGSGFSGSGVDRYNYSGNDMTTSSVGGGAAHQNTQPSLILNYIIKT